jgi:hypothetical protein
MHSRSSCSTARSPGLPSLLPEIRKLWAVIDEVHSAIQRIQQVLVNINYTPEGIADNWVIEAYVLLGARTDTGLVDLCYLVHGSLLRVRDSGGVDLNLINAILVDSDLRVRKCLKLFACVYFYVNTRRLANVECRNQLLLPGCHVFSDTTKGDSTLTWRHSSTSTRATVT